MDKLFKGVVIEESLIDNRVINGLDIIGFRISMAENPADRWHMYTVSISKEKN